MLKAWVLCAAALAAPIGASAEVPLQVFAQHDEFRRVRISPDGKYLAAMVPEKGLWALVSLPLADPQKAVKILPLYNTGVADFAWAGPNRLIAELAEVEGMLDVPQLTGELMGVNADGSDETYLFGYRGGGSTGTHTQHVNATYGSAEIVATLRKDPEHTIVATESWDNTNVDNMVVETYKLNVQNGLLDNMHAAPFTGGARFLTDRGGDVRYVMGLDSHLNLLTYARAGDGDWQQVNTGKLENAHVYPIAFSEDASRAYLSSDEGSDRQCLVEHVLASGERRKLSCDDSADLDHAIFSFDDKEPIAATYLNDRPSIRLLDTSNPDRARLAALQKAFPGQLAEPVSATPDGSKVVVFV